jgi:hypothetical protein
MPENGGTNRPGDGAGQPVGVSQNLWGGLMLLALAALALWLTRDLGQGTLGEMGPAMLPRWLAVAVGLCGVALIASAFRHGGEVLGRWNLRGPALVTLGIVAFGLTIRSFPLGPVMTPGLGLLFAGPLAILISSYATDEATLTERLVLALGLTAFCMVLFADVLNLPVPLYPRFVEGLFPAGWSPKAVLRTVAALLAATAALLVVISRRRIG